MNSKVSASMLRALAVFGLSVGMAIGCSGTSPKLIPNDSKPGEKIHDTGETTTYNASVDILFVVDNSQSMDAHQQDVAKNIQLFINALSTSKLADYHYGVLTSTYHDWMYPGSKGGDGKLVGPPTVIDMRTPGGPAQLARNILVGTDGSGTEKFFDPVMAALTSPLIDNENKGFYRPDANLAIVFLTDGEDLSDGASVQQFYDFLVKTLKKGDKKKVQAYGVLIPSTDMSCNRGGEIEPTRLEELIGLTGGTSMNLCDPNFGQKLATIGLDIVQKVGNLVYLKRIPIEGTIAVKYGTQTIPNDPVTGWVYDPQKNALLLGPGIQWTVQPVGTKLEVTFNAVQ